jgi:hypothetical protein
MMARCCGGLAGSSSSCGLARAARMVFDLLGFSGEDQANAPRLTESGIPWSWWRLGPIRRCIGLCAGAAWT